MRLDEFELKFAKFFFAKNNTGRKKLWLKLAKLLGNGVPILTAIESIRKRRIEAGGKGDPTTVALGNWAMAIQGGRRFSDAVNGWVSTEEVMIISAGEQSGKIEQALHSCCKFMEAKKEISGAVIGGLLYPAVLVMMAIGVMIMFSYKIIPAFTDVAPNAKWTGQAAMMVDLAEWTKNWIIYVIVFGVMSVLAFFWSLPRMDGKLRVTLDRYAPYSIYRIMQGSSWLISFAALIEAGTRMEDALQQISRYGSPWMKNRMQAILRNMRAGHNLGDALARTKNGFPDVEIIDDLGVYASLSGFDSALAMLGKEWIEESVKVIKERMKVVFAAAILFMGAVIAFMVSGLFAMQIQMSNAMKMAF